MRRFLLGILCLCSIQFLAAQDQYDPKNPHMPIESALAAARKAVKAQGFNPEGFEVQVIQWIATWKLSEEAKRLAEEKKHPGYVDYAAMMKEFGEGPFWKVDFWRTKRAGHSGDWYDDQRFGLYVLVYAANKVAVVDGRTWKLAEDKIESSSEDAKK